MSRFGSSKKALVIALFLKKITKINYFLIYYFAKTDYLRIPVFLLPIGLKRKFQQSLV
jgi:hypothetical protein